MAFRLRAVASRLALSSGVACSVAAATWQVSRAEAAAEPAAAADDEPKPKPCLNLTLLQQSSTNVLNQYAPKYARVLADRVLVRPCMTEALSSLNILPLAIVEDGSSQSMLIVPRSPLWHGPADISVSGRVGYPVLPISMAEEEAAAPAAAPAATAPPAPSEGGAAGKGAASGGGDGAEAAAAPEPPTLWEQIEEPWRLLEASGVLIIERDADSMPTSAQLATGGAAWEGELPVAGGNRRLSVRMIDAAAAAQLVLRGRTAAPECGFCRYMKAGPCGELFVAWEACVDAARDSGEDFVEACGKPTLALKACTDQHHEYYGELADGGDDDDAGSAPPTSNATTTTQSGDTP
jgi:hypothetical protein